MLGLLAIVAIGYLIAGQTGALYAAVGAVVLYVLVALE